MGFSRPDCVLVGSQGVSQLQESCSGKRNSRDAERRKCEVRPLKDILSKKKKKIFHLKGRKAEMESVYI